jgi:cyclic pyranopterin phosphate synthase
VTAQPDGRTRTTGALTHLDEQGRVRMVDVSAKPLTRRLAVARCAVITTVDAIAALADAVNGVDLVEAARVAGIQGAKRTSSLVPLCHPIRVDRVAVDVEVSRHRVEITAVTESGGRSGEWQRGVRDGERDLSSSPPTAGQERLGPQWQGQIS